MHALSALTDDLFAPSILQLVEDAEGGICYWPRFIGHSADMIRMPASECCVVVAAATHV